MRRILLFLLPLLLLTVLAYPRLRHRYARLRHTQAANTTVQQLAPRLRNGDLIFQTSQSAQSQAILLATHSAYSHCGILFRRNGQWRVF